MKLTWNAIAVELWLDDAAELEELEAIEDEKDAELALRQAMREIKQLAIAADNRGDTKAARELWGEYSDMYKDVNGVRPW